MFSILFDIIFNLLATIVQIVLLPLNALIESLLPDLSEKILYLTNNLPNLFSGISFFVNILPPVTRSVFLFAIQIMLAKYSIYYSSRALIHIWNVVQKLKFW